MGFGAALKGLFRLGNTEADALKAERVAARARAAAAAGGPEYEAAQAAALAARRGSSARRGGSSAVSTAEEAKGASSGFKKVVSNAKLIRNFAILGGTAATVLTLYNNLEELGLDQDTIDAIFEAIDFVAENYITIMIVFIVIWMSPTLLTKMSSIMNSINNQRDNGGTGAGVTRAVNSISNGISNGITGLTNSVQVPRMQGMQGMQPPKSFNGLPWLLLILLVVIIGINYWPSNPDVIEEVIEVPGSGDCSTHTCPSNTNVKLKRINLPELKLCGPSGTEACTNEICCFDASTCSDVSLCALKRADNNWVPEPISLIPNGNDLQLPCIDKITGSQIMTEGECGEGHHDLNSLIGGWVGGLDTDLGTNISKDKCNLLNVAFSSIENVQYEYESTGECLEDLDPVVGSVASIASGKYYPKCQYSREGNQAIQSGLDQFVSGTHTSVVTPPCIYEPIKEYTDGHSDKYLFMGWANGGTENVKSNLHGSVSNPLVYGSHDPPNPDNIPVNRDLGIFLTDNTVRDSPSEFIDRIDHLDTYYTGRPQGEKLEVTACSRACSYDNSKSVKNLETGSENGRRCNGFAFKGHNTGDFDGTERKCLRIGEWPTNIETHNLQRYGPSVTGGVEHCAGECDAPELVDDDTKVPTVGATSMRYPYRVDIEGSLGSVGLINYYEQYCNVVDNCDHINYVGECRSLMKWDRSLLNLDSDVHDEADSANTPLYSGTLDDEVLSHRPVYPTCETLRDTDVPKKLYDPTTVQYLQNQDMLNNRRPSRSKFDYNYATIDASETDSFAVFERLTE